MSATIRWATCSPATNGCGASRSCIRWAGTPSACRPRMRRWSARSTPAMDLGQYRDDEGAAEAARLRARLEPRARHLRSRLLRPRAGLVPRSVRRRPRLSQGERGQLGPGRHDRARQRAGDRRPRLALRRAGRAAQAQPVVPEDHRLRRGAARRAGDARPMARQGPADAGELDRQEPGHEVPLRARPSRRRCRDRGLHHPPRHDLRRELRRRLARPSACPELPRKSARGGRVHRPTASRAARPRPSWRRRRSSASTPASRSLHPLDPDWESAGLHRQFRADGLWHRRDLRRAGARPARLRVRHQIRPADPPRRRCRAPTRRTGRSRARRRAAPACSSIRAFSTAWMSRAPRRR